jgi:hypothetical protein
MDVLELARTVLRRWPVVVPVLLATLLGAYWLHARTDVVYHAGGSLLLSSSALTGNGAEAPEAPADAPLSGAVLAELLQRDEVRSDVVAAGGTEEYYLDYESTDSIMRVWAIDDDEDAVVTSVREVLEAIEPTARARQGPGTPAGSRVDVEILTTPSRALQENVTEDGEERTRYTATGSARLFNTASDEPANPYAGDYRVTGSILQELAASPQAREQLRELGATAEYTATLEAGDFAPIMHVTATGDDPEAVMRTYEEVASYLQRTLDERQAAAGVPDDLLLLFEPLSTPEEAERATGSLRRPLVALVGLGVVVAISLAVLIDGFMVRKSPATSSYPTEFMEQGGTWPQTARSLPAGHPEQDRAPVTERVGP